MMNVNKPWRPRLPARSLAPSIPRVSYQRNRLFSCLRNYRSLNGTRLAALIRPELHGEMRAAAAHISIPYFFGLLRQLSLLPPGSLQL